MASDDGLYFRVLSEAKTLIGKMSEGITLDELFNKMPELSKISERQAAKLTENLVHNKTIFVKTDGERVWLRHKRFIRESPAKRLTREPAKPVPKAPKQKAEPIITKPAPVVDAYAETKANLRQILSYFATSPTLKDEQKQLARKLNSACLEFLTASGKKL